MTFLTTFRYTHVSRISLNTIPVLGLRYGLPRGLARVTIPAAIVPKPARSGGPVDSPAVTVRLSCPAAGGLSRVFVACVGPGRYAYREPACNRQTKETA